MWWLIVRSCVLPSSYDDLPTMIVSHKLSMVATRQQYPMILFLLHLGGLSGGGYVLGLITMDRVIPSDKELLFRFRCQYSCAGVLDALP